MKEYLEQINAKIKSRTKEQWIGFLNYKLSELRAYISNNGEISFVAAFVLGIFVVVFFRLAFAVFFICALIFAMIWCLADSDIEIRNRKPSDLTPAADIDEDGNNTPVQ